MSNSELKSKTILITGATSGIGLALAELAAARHYQVVACGRNADVLSRLEQTENIRTLQFDVSDEEQTRLTLQHTVADIYVLNAGVCEYVDTQQFNSALFKRVFDANFFGVVNCVTAILPRLVKGNQIVLVDSLARLLPFTQSEAYGASKAALYYFSQSLQVDVSQQGVLVQSVSPGFIETPMTAKNTFRMPMAISAETAALSLLNAIEKKQPCIYFPWFFSLLLRVLGWLPERWKMRLCRQLKQSSK